MIHVHGKNQQEGDKMEDTSILNDIKKAIPITVEDTSFDDILIFHTNHALALIIEKGYGPVEGFTINGAETKWSEFTDRNDALPFIKNYCGFKVKLLFDPPLSAAVIDSYNKCLLETENMLSLKE